MGMISRGLKVWFSLLFLISFILPTGPVSHTFASAASESEEQEPNDTMNFANELISGEARYGAISSAADIDYYGINTQRGGDIRITLENLPMDYELFLYDANGNELGSSTQSSTTSESINYTAYESGVYYILVKSYTTNNYSPNGKYKIKTHYPSDAPNFNAVYEPNDTKENAFPVSSGKEYFGTIDSSLDRDFYQIHPNGEGQIRATLENLPFDYDLFLFDAQGEKVESSTSSGTSVEVINYYTTNTDGYYIGVFPSGSNYSAASNYKVRISYPSNVDKGSAYEPNDIKEQAYPLQSGKVYSEKISSPTDVDNYSFTAEREGTIYARLEQLPFDYDLKLLDRNGNVAATSSNSGKTDEVIEFRVSEAGTYYLYVYPIGTAYSSTFSYKVLVTYPTENITFDKELESNDTAESAFPAVSMKTYSQLINAGNDQDFYKFNVNPGKKVNISLKNVPFDYDLFVYDKAGNLVTSSTGSGTSEESISFENIESSTYYVKVKSDNRLYSTINRYNLKITYGLFTRPKANALSSNKTFITGTADPNVIIQVKKGYSVIGTGRTNVYGAYSIKIPKQTYNTKLTLAAQDDAGNTSSTVTTVQRGAYAPKINTVKSNSTTISGTAGPNMAVTVKRGYTVIGTGKATSSGYYSVKIPKQKMSTSLAVIIKDSFGDTASATTKVQTHISVPKVNNVTTKSTKITGYSGAYLTVMVKYGSKVVASGKTTSRGTFSLKMKKQKKKAKLVVYVKDSVGNYNYKTIYVK